ncbi:MAG TPA: hypothetical protein VHU17_01075, partial [Acidimicrobiales bacterium]|nr:hypothetical protein [Acidimicrobiales bacterium]
TKLDDRGTATSRHPDERAGSDCASFDDHDTREIETDRHRFGGRGRSRPAYRLRADARRAITDHHDNGASFDDDHHATTLDHHNRGTPVDDDYHGVPFDHHDGGASSDDHHDDDGWAIGRKPDRTGSRSFASEFHKVMRS